MTTPRALGSCLICQAPAAERHHPTGRRGRRLPYLDAGFTVPLCRACHVAEHAALREIGLGW